MKVERLSLLLAFTFLLLLFWQVPIGVFDHNTNFMSLTASLLFKFNLILLFSLFLGSLPFLLFLQRLPRLKAITQFMVCFLIFFFWFNANVPKLDPGHAFGSRHELLKSLLQPFLDGAVGVLLFCVAKGLMQRPKILEKVLVIFCFSVFCDGAVRLVRIGATKSDRLNDFAVDYSKDFTFSKVKNIIVVVWDEFQSDVFARILQKRPDLAQGMKDFTFFPDTASGFLDTVPSVPLILTGEFFNNDKPFKEYLIDSYSRPTNFLHKLKEVGFVRHIRPWQSFTYFAHPDIFDNVLPSWPFVENLKGYVLVYQYSFLAILPAILQISNDSEGDWLENPTIWSFVEKQRYAKNTPTKTPTELDQFDILKSDRDWDYHSLVSMNRFIDSKSESPVFKFYHFSGAHTPFSLAADGKPMADLGWAGDESLASYEQKAEYKIYLMTVFLDILKKQGLYENSLLVFLGDHGMGLQADSQNLVDPDSGFPQSNYVKIKARANPLLIMKPMQASNKEIVVSADSLSLQDLGRLVLENLNSKDSPKLSPSIRRNISVEYNPGIGEYVEEYAEWIIGGHVRKDSSWSPYHIHEAGKHTACVFEDYDVTKEIAEMNFSLSRKSAKSFELLIDVSAQFLPNLGVLIEFPGNAGEVSIQQEGKEVFAQKLNWQGPIPFTQSPFLVVPLANRKDSQVKIDIETSDVISKIKRIRFFALSPKRDTRFARHPEGSRGIAY